MFTRFASRLAAGAFTCVLTGCANQASPTNWTLWYIPNEPKQGDAFAKLCHTFVFSNPPEAKTFRVVTVEGLSGSDKKGKHRLHGHWRRVQWTARTWTGHDTR